jgi:hypothetical protein
MQPHNVDSPVRERLAGPVERVTFHSEQSGFCILRVKVMGQRDLMTVIGSAASVSTGESIEAQGAWANLERAAGARRGPFPARERVHIAGGSAATPGPSARHGVGERMPNQVIHHSAAHADPGTSG